MPAEIRSSPGVFTEAAIAACVARMIASRSRPLMMISITEPTFSGNCRLCRGVALQHRAVFFVGARDGKAVLAARLRSAAGDAAREGHDDAGATVDGRHAGLRGSQGSALGFAEEPQVAAHQPVRVTQPPIENELTAKVGIHHILRPKRSIRFWKPSPK